jgi:hypothetical protein
VFSCSLLSSSCAAVQASLRKRPEGFPDMDWQTNQHLREDRAPHALPSILGLLRRSNWTSQCKVLPETQLCGLAVDRQQGTPSLVLYPRCIPESPRWLISQNKNAKAMKIIKHIAKKNGKSVPVSLQVSWGLGVKCWVLRREGAENMPRVLVIPAERHGAHLLAFWPHCRKIH